MLLIQGELLGLRLQLLLDFLRRSDGLRCLLAELGELRLGPVGRGSRVLLVCLDFCLLLLVEEHLNLVL